MSKMNGNAREIDKKMDPIPIYISFLLSMLKMCIELSIITITKIKN